MVGRLRLVLSFQRSTGAGMKPIELYTRLLWKNVPAAYGPLRRNCTRANEVGAEVLLAISREFSKSLGWLLTGEE